MGNSIQAPITVVITDANGNELGVVGGTKGAFQRAPLAAVLTDADGYALNIVAGTPGTGTVTSISMTVPSFMTISGSPLTDVGTLALAFSNKNPNLILAGPTNGGAATPAFRSLVAADIPDLSSLYGSSFAVVSKVADYVANAGEVVLVDSTGGDVNVTLPSLASKQPVIVKKVSSDVNNVIVLPPSGTIDGAANKTISSQYGSNEFIPDGSNYWVI